MPAPLPRNDSNVADPIYLGTIKYVDFESHCDSMDIYLRRLMRKHKAFEHEQEIRVVFSDNQYREKSGVDIPIEVAVIIESIVIAPRAEEWFAELVKALVEKLGYAIPVTQSTLAKAVPFEWGNGVANT